MGEEKSAQDAELMAINVSHAQLQGKLKEQTYILSSTKKKFGEMYNRINYLEKKVVPNFKDIFPARDVMAYDGVYLA
ncbi:hypothetical protein POTOM_001948 [Populus tomentosa]|uniref:Uncharacterized protein n=1 Tax=Populus tomentosa TaxID=118781 RepID=A0A8X8DIT2_POPTO|nr:hypothetical protein POTOM_001948 [Populus tomentosa]